MRIVECLDAAGFSPFRGWFDALAAQAAAKITVGLKRIEQGNLSNAKSVGAGVLEYRIDFGPGYRQDGVDLVILLAGGTKRRQQRDIETAQTRWADYKGRKKGAT